LTFEAKFEQAHIRDPFFSIVSTAPLIEVAYPGRFVRNASGQLTSINTTPVNAGAQDTTDLRLGITFSSVVGSTSGQTITRSIPQGGVKSALPPGAIVIMADDSNATGSVFDDSESRKFASIHFTAHLLDKFVLPNGTIFNALVDGAPDDSFSKPAVNLLVQTGIYRKGLGASLRADYTGSRKLRLAQTASLTTAGFSYLAPSMILDIDTFTNLDKFSHSPIFVNARINLSLKNVFNMMQQSRQNTMMASSDMLPYFLNPLGRILSFSFHKSW
jgi:hypothetical protein